MARIAGATLPANKKIEIALRYIYGIGATSATIVLKATGIDGNIRTKDLQETQVQKLNEALRAHRLEGDLRRDILSNIKRLKEIHAYRGVRHERGLPVRGQRTKTNSRTRRGNTRKTVGSGKKKGTEKT
ncbi:30S ribosomal protein S13 [Candidatus Uhrbacteria bacterium]|nr:30S ribosomal protein S13 [Candidatus Uhrbacteria bacterium]